LTEFQTFRAEDGKYRWRLVEDGRAVGVRPGRVRIAGFSGRKKKSVEAALDRALAKIAGASERRAAKD
jgi:hypothetical protein